MNQAHMEYALNNNKVIKFILIDHSLESNGGHHFDYSQRVLEAAKYLGYKTILLANSKFQTNAVNGVDVLIKKFDHNYWQYRNPLIKTFIKHLFYSQKISWLNFEALVFAKELKESLKNIDLEGGDLIFMPMLGASELIGVGIFSKLNLEMGLHWNFVFRRSFNLGFGLRSIFERRIISAALYKFTRCFRGASANFYTDTENLSSEYSKLGFSEFMTLPVPVSDGMKLKEKWDGVRPLRIVYLGDARDEKGYQFLPQLVAGVRDAGLTHEFVHFIFQSNLSSGGNTKSIVAKNKLIEFQDKGLTLIEGPFTSEEYNELLKKSDILVLPYSSREYASRSSGIFAEAAAAGVPTIFPKDSWMAQEAGGICGVGFDNFTTLLDCTLGLIGRYKEYERQSIKLATRFQEKFSAKKLVNSLLINLQGVK